jgi:hypothetical protein
MPSVTEIPTWVSSKFAAFSILSMIFTAQYMVPVFDLAAASRQNDAAAAAAAGQ